MIESLAARSLNAAVVRLTRNLKLNVVQSQLREPIVSFSFDDVPRSAFTEGGRILKEVGWSGTYFVAGSFCGRRVDNIDYMDRDDLLQADQEGHEIGCHTYSHLRLRKTSATAIRDDLKRNDEFLRDILPENKFSSFAYPFGDVNLGNKMLLSDQYPICRGIWDGINHGRMDFAQLNAVGLERHKNRTLEDIEAWIDQAVRTNGWLIFFTHDVSNDPSPFGCPTDLFASTVESVAKRGIRVCTVKNAAGLSAIPLKAVH